ncbi:MAG: CRISPR-associated helicase Cas3' [Desulfitobacteriia bacterium]
MEKLSRAAQSLWAKKSAKDGNLQWLPLTAHQMDSALVARKLWRNWLSDGAKRIISSEIRGENDAERLLVFLAAVHDLGKATPVFQIKNARPPCRDLDESLAEEQIRAGLPLRTIHEFSKAGKTPHALATQVILEEAGCNKNVAGILGAHHGKPPSHLELEYGSIRAQSFNYHLEREGKEIWTAVQQELIDFALRLAGFSTLEEIPIPNMAAQVLLSGLLIMADWVASNEKYFPYFRLEDKIDLSKFNIRAQKAWQEVKLPHPWEISNLWMGTDLCLERFGFESNILQCQTAQSAGAINAPGFMIIEAPMGYGKTEAALVCAEIFAYKTKRAGIFFALPTQATSDGIFPRILNWIDSFDDYDQHVVELVHGKAQFNEDFQSLKVFEGSANIGEDENSNIIVHEWFEGQKKSLLADFVVGTIDQLLMAALKQKHVMLRHLGLANKIVIIDECHAYDAYMGQYLERALNWLGAYRVPVIMLSATLPPEKRQALMDAYLMKNTKKNIYDCQDDPLGRGTKILTEEKLIPNDNAYPMLTYSDGEKVNHKAVPPERDIYREVSLTVFMESELEERLADLLSVGGCAGVIVNTVRRAQEIARILEKRFGEETVRLLHSRFLTPDRYVKERELLTELGKPSASANRPFRRIVVGTQVFEQSLDIDFDILVTDICPMDLLLQRIGRLHRHRRKRPEKLSTARCLIMGVEGDDFEAGTKAVYGKYLLMRTKAFLPQKVILPKDIPQLVQHVYDSSLKISPEPLGYLEAKKIWEKQKQDKETRAQNFQIDKIWSGSEYNLIGWLDTDVPFSERHGEAAVRDIDESIEVLLVQEKKDANLYFLPWIENGCALPVDEIPDAHTARAIARQRIRLPRVFCLPGVIDRTIEELEYLNGKRLFQWQESPWLKGELVLIVDEQFRASLGGYSLIYDQKYGLLYEKEVDEDD